MVKKVVAIAFVFSTFVFAENLEKKEQNIYEQNCIPCHKPLSVGLDKFFFRYLMKYSSELSVKSALTYFLKNPDELTSALSSDQLRRFGVKSKTNLNDEELNEAIDIYWEKYKVFEKIE